MLVRTAYLPVCIDFEFEKSFLVMDLDSTKFKYNVAWEEKASRIALLKKKKALV